MKSKCCGARMSREIKNGEFTEEYWCDACATLSTPTLRSSEVILELVKKVLKIQQETHIKYSLDYRNGWRDGIEGFCETLIQFIEGKE
jgi:hypothetical protein